MPMNAPEHPGALRQTDHVPEHRGNPSVHTTPRERCPNEPAPPRRPVGPDTPDEGAFMTFVGGAGI
jgi:hypothetical protein